MQMVAKNSGQRQNLIKGLSANHRANESRSQSLSPGLLTSTGSLHSPALLSSTSCVSMQTTIRVPGSEPTGLTALVCGFRCTCSFLDHQRSTVPGTLELRDD